MMTESITDFLVFNSFKRHLFFTMFNMVKQYQFEIQSVSDTINIGKCEHMLHHLKHMNSFRSHPMTSYK